VDVTAPGLTNVSLTEIAAMDLEEVRATANPVLLATVERLCATDARENPGSFGSFIDLEI
jgi:hypothetical protein